MDMEAKIAGFARLEKRLLQAVSGESIPGREGYLQTIQGRGKGSSGASFSGNLPSEENPGFSPHIFLIHLSF